MERVGVEQTQLNAPVHPQPSDAHSISYVLPPYGLDFEQSHPSRNFSQIVCKKIN